MPHTHCVCLHSRAPPCALERSVAAPDRTYHASPAPVSQARQLHTLAPPVCCLRLDFPLQASFHTHSPASPPQLSHSPASPPPPHLAHFPHISPICHTPHSNSSPDNSFSILPQPDLRQQCYSEPPKRGEAGSLQWGEHHIFTLPNVDPQTISSGTLTIQLLEASLSRICHTPICLSRICHTPMCLSRICHTPICLTPIRQTPIGHTWHFSQPSLPH